MTDFRILCFAKKGNNYQRVGLYTPDFLIIKRKDNAIANVLIVETKGSGYAEQTTFKLRKKFMETEFLQMNNDKFGYKKFELFLQDDAKFDNLAKLNETIVEFLKIKYMPIKYISHIPNTVEGHAILDNLSALAGN